MEKRVSVVCPKVTGWELNIWDTYLRTSIMFTLIIRIKFNEFGDVSTISGVKVREKLEEIFDEEKHRYDT